MISSRAATWMIPMNKENVLKLLNDLIEHEYAGVLRYSHYSLMVFGFNRIPIVKWLREQATESLAHAESIGEQITTLGGHPSLKVGQTMETHKHSLVDILKESLEHERAQIALLGKLLAEVQGKHIPLEEFTRGMICDEELHISEIEKMLRGSANLS